MARIFCQIGGCLDPELTDLSVKAGLARQADRAGKLSIVLVELATNIDAATIIAAGDGEFMRPPSQTLCAGAGRFEPGAGGDDCRMSVQSGSDGMLVWQSRLSRQWCREREKQ